MSLQTYLTRVTILHRLLEVKKLAHNLLHSALIPSQYDDAKSRCLGELFATVLFLQLIFIAFPYKYTINVVFLSVQVQMH